MTTTAYSYVNFASQSGGYISWFGLSSLTTSTTNKAYRSGTSVYFLTNTIAAHTPEYMDTLLDGATMNAINVKFKAYNAAGTGETAFHEAASQLHKSLDALGIKHVLFESAGTAHEWQTWRRSLNDFAPRLFR